MKKIKLIIPLVLATVSTMAQDSYAEKELQIKESSYHLFAMLLTLTVWSVIIIYFIKMLLDHKIKNKLLEKGAPESVVTQLLQPAVNDKKDSIFKWICLLASGGAGLLLTNYYQPLGIQSLAILCLCLAAGLLIYFFYIKITQKRD